MDYVQTRPFNFRYSIKNSLNDNVRKFRQNQFKTYATIEKQSYVRFRRLISIRFLYDIHTKKSISIWEDGADIRDPISNWHRIFLIPSYSIGFDQLGRPIVVKSIVYSSHSTRIRHTHSSQCDEKLT